MLRSSSQVRRESAARGLRAEEWIAGLLRAQGWVILAQNWRGGGGELDLVMRKDSQLRFVEVKARSSSGMRSDELLPVWKQRRLCAAADAWMSDQAVSLNVEDICFLLAMVDCSGADWSVRWLDDAFDEI